MTRELLEKHRWLVIPGCVLVQLALGAVYSWSVFTGRLKDDFGFTAAQTQWIFGALLVTNALVQLVAGRLQKRFGPRLVAMAGALLFAAAFLLASVFGQSFWGQFLCIGLLGGAGMGLVYVMPIAVGMRWYPERKGLITGLAVSGFGLGALGWIKLAEEWGGLLESHGVLGTFRIFGVLFLGMMLLGSLVLVYPDKGRKISFSASRTVDPGLGPWAMLRRPAFYALWFSYLFSAMAGLMLIGVNKLFGRDVLLASGAFPDMEAASLAASGAFALAFVLANGFGRILWGLVADRLGWRPAALVMTGSQAGLMLAIYFAGGDLFFFTLLLGWAGFNFGGNFALFPVAAGELFGQERFAENYPFLNLAYGVGGVAGPLMAGLFKDFGADQGVSAWLGAFVVSAGLCLLAFLILAFGLRPLTRR
ncbi:MAG: MFS transporter [Deltaproteobacteria bacterium]|nr:MFS transporter [Deltaproteobacteria bacterium]